MKLQDVLMIAKKKFENEIDTSDWFQKIAYTLKTPYNNNFVTIRELKDADYFEITFFRSDRNLNDLYDDYSEVGITFYPRFIDDVLLLFNSVDV